MIFKSTSVFRFNKWGKFILPPVLSIALLTIALQSKQPLEEVLMQLSAFIISFLATASFGFFSNDIADIESDQKAGKSNFASKVSKYYRLPVLIILLLFALVPWILIINNTFGKVAFSLLVTEILLLVFYSFPPFRFKNKAFLGAICDALYAHLLPALIALYVFSFNHAIPLFFLIILMGLFFLKGLRNIIVHQINDRKADRLSQTNTFILSYGVDKSVKLINKIILPFEVVLLFAIAIFTYSFLPWLLWTFTFFLCWNLISFWSWTKNYGSGFRMYKWFWSLLNNYYEIWLAYIACVTFVNSYSLSYFWIIPLIILLPPPLKRIIEELKTIGREIAASTRYHYWKFNKWFYETLISVIKFFKPS